MPGEAAPPATPNPATPAAPTPPPSTPPPQSPPTPPPAKPEGDDRHPGVPKLMASLFKQVPAEDESNGNGKKKDAPAATPPPKAGDEQPADGKKPEAAPTPSDPPIRGRKREIKRPEIPVAKPEAQVAPTPAPVPPQAPARNWEDDLIDTEKEMLSDAREMEKRFPGKHTGLAARTEKFIREHMEMVKRIESGEIDDTSPEYQAWLRANKPMIGRADIEELREARILEKSRKEYDTKLEDFHHELFVRDEAPKVKQEADKFYIEVARGVLPDEVMQEMQRNGGGQAGYEKAKEQYGMEIEIAENVLGVAASDVEEFHALSRNNPKTGRPMKQFDPNNEQHQRLASLIGSVCEDFKNSGGKELQRNNKWFVTRDEWNQMPQEARGQFWTFTNEEIIKRSQVYVKAAVSKAIETRHETLKKWNVGRLPRQQPAPAPAAQPPQPRDQTPPPPPAPRPSPVAPAPNTQSDQIDHRAKSLAGLLGNRT